MHTPEKVFAALQSLAGLNITISDIILCLLGLNPEQLDPLCSHALLDIASNYFTLLDAFKIHATFAEGTQEWIHNSTIEGLDEEAYFLTRKTTGWHGKAYKANTKQFESVNAGVLAETAKTVAPHLWNLFERLIIHDKESVLEEDVVDDLQIDRGTLDGDQEAARRQVLIRERVAKQRKLRTVHLVTSIARMRNQQCNAFSTHMGLFLHASGTAHRVIDSLAQIGLSTSSPSIDRTVTSLYEESQKEIRAAAQSLKYLMAYDNLVIDFGSPGQSTVENSQRSLWNLTTGTFINQYYDPEDLRCADEVRKRDPYNDEEDQSKIPEHNYYDLLDPGSSDLEGLDTHMRFFAWSLLNVLCTHGPPFFHQFRPRLGDPEIIEALPVRKTDQVPVRAMKHDNSSVSGNISALEDMMKQGGIKRHSPTEEPVVGEPEGISEYVLLVSGDLGTGERIDTARRRRARDICLWNNLYYVIFIPGMFHVKMAMVDALWRLFIKPFSDTTDPTSAGNATRYLCPRPKDAHKILKGPPTYQQTKRFLKHLRVAEHLTCWRTALEERFGPSIWSDLEDNTFIAQFTLRFTWDNIVAMSKELVKTFFNGPSIYALKKNPVAQSRDRELENTMMRNYYMLFYEETVYAMDHGDIGRLERCLIDWIPVFRAVGKHKYAHHLTTFFLNIRYVYPEKLGKAVRRSILCNPSGRVGKFQGNDWIVELNNLYTKVIYGGKGSNRTLERVLKESPLIQVYRNVLTSVESLFILGPQTVKHGEPDMKKTYEELVRELDKNGLFRHSPGRKTEKEIIDAFGKGHEILNLRASELGEESEEPDSMAHYDEDDIENGIDIE